ncbi:RING-type E3 ubiquitin-protein ligase PPIL2 [Toxorhynchites rutilus septentrionalis]|uniref:RING-type E3 ubiquitin-protein ligase PPIL2 n=1 Tax=Toxorhynchites rutilus septentrionalis TaxID=329112 RepID=UPI002478C15D|nr:RING-type E3 ubiquitin-protein ligase PPIL2 [Toxorhynchites rutilus septentrionalis]
MGKKQHQKDKMYLTYTEWSELYGGHKPDSAENEQVKFKRLPFDHCCLSMVPFEHPYCDKNGNVFELSAIVDFIKHFKVNPVTGEALDGKSLIKLNFTKNHEGQYHCPILFKPFSKNSHIVANGKTGNIFSYEAIEQLNVKAKNWKDLIDDTSFVRKDLITIQDPSNLEKFNITTFHHIRKNLRVLTEEEQAEKKDPQGRLKTISMETREILTQLEKDYKAPEVKQAEHKMADKFNAAHYSTGAVAAAFTSTSMVPVLNHEAAIIEEDVIRYERVKKKGYVRLLTNFGALNLELYCDQVPKTCENFLKHCTTGYYNGCIFHRSIRNFMIQGGDPTGVGNGGTSIWGKKFTDEIKPNLTHSGRGILAMANSGPNTNGSQFFITYRSCRHLDGKHTIFGKLVGGLEVLTEMERVEVDNRDRPIENIFIQRVQVFVDPFQEADEQLANERSAELERIQREVQEKEKKSTKAQPLQVFRSGVGKYLDKDRAKKLAEPDSASVSGANLNQTKKRKIEEKISKLGNFSSW